MKRVIYPVLLVLAVLTATGPRAVAAQGLDLLAGRAGDVSVCAMTPRAALDAFGIPSRKVAESAGLRLEFSHHGFVLAFAGNAEDSMLASVTVYAVDREGYRGYNGHFLGTVANGTRSDPVRRLLRSARADVLRDEAERIEASLGGFELAIGFLYDAIDWVTLTCPAGRNATG